MPILHRLHLLDKVYVHSYRAILQHQHSSEHALEEIMSNAKHGDPEAQNTLGKMYRDGNGVPKDKKRAISWFQRASQNQHEEAKQNLRKMYE